MARDRGAFVVFGGIHATLYPTEAQELGAAHAVVQGDGKVVWATVLADCANGEPHPMYDGGRVGHPIEPSRRVRLIRKSKISLANACHRSPTTPWRPTGPAQRGRDARHTW